MFNWLRKSTTPQTGWSASAYMTEDHIIIHTRSRTSKHSGWYNQPVFRLSINSDQNEIGNRLRTALEASIWNSQTDDSQLSPHPVLVEAGFKSWNALEQNSRHVSIDTDKIMISMTPCRPAKSGEGHGFVGLDENFEIHWDSDDTEIGGTLLTAFDSSATNDIA